MCLGCKYIVTLLNLTSRRKALFENLVTFVAKCQIILQEALLRNPTEKKFCHIMLNLTEKFLKHSGFSKLDRWTGPK